LILSTKRQKFLPPFLFYLPTFKWSLTGYNMEEAPFYEEKG